MYSIGDRVKIVDKWGPGCRESSKGEMDKWLGKVMTVRAVEHCTGFCFYRMEEDSDENISETECGWMWFPTAIEGHAKESFKINSISLLDTIRYADYRDIIPSTSSWWIKTPVPLASRLATVHSDGQMCLLSAPDREKVLAVRPALWFSSDFGHYKQKDKISLLGLKWTVLHVDTESGELLALCDEVVANRRFDKDSCIWDASELKWWLEEWLEYSVMGVDNITYGSGEDFLFFPDPFEGILFKNPGEESFP